MKESKEETKLQSEQETAEDGGYEDLIVRLIHAKTRVDIVGELQRHDIQRYLRESQFKSQLPIEQKNELELIIAEKNIDIIHLRDRIKELESQPLPIEQKADYEYEMFFDDDGPINIHGWLPIATDRIKNPEKIPHYLEIGLLRRKSQPLPIEGVENKFLLHLVDVVACFATEQNIFYATKTRMELIQKARETFKGNG